MYARGAWVGTARDRGRGSVNGQAQAQASFKGMGWRGLIELRSRGPYR